MRPNINQVRSTGHPTELYRWDLKFTKFPIAVAAPPSSDDLNFRCESISLPDLKRTNTPIEFDLRGHHMKYNGIYKYTNTITLVFVETVNNLVSSFIKKWKDACWDPETGIGHVRDDLLAQIRLERLNPANVPIWEYEIKNCFPDDSDPSGAGLDGGTSDALKPSLILSYDYFKDGPI